MGGGSDVWEKFPNNVVFFLKAYLIDLFVKILKSKSPKPLTQFHMTQQIKKNHSLETAACQTRHRGFSSHVLALASNSCLRETFKNVLADFAR